MHIMFKGDPAELAAGGGLSRTRITLYGREFAMGEPVDVSDLTDLQRAKLAGNHHFEVVDMAAPAAEPEPAAPAVEEKLEKLAAPVKKASGKKTEAE